MADVWLGISSSHIDSYCGDTGGRTLALALDGTDIWQHNPDEDHWFILDLGQTYTIKKVRGRSNYGDYDPIYVNIYVSDDKANWGTAVATIITTWQDTETWQEVDTIDKDGRYIKVIIYDTEDANRLLIFGKSGGMTIFDAYGDVPFTLHELVVTDGIALTDPLVKNPIKVLADGIALSDVLIKNPIKVLTDAIALSDVLVKLQTHVRVFSDGIAFTDILVKGTIKVLADGIAIADTLIKMWVHRVLRILNAVRNLTSVREDGTKR